MYYFLSFLYCNFLKYIYLFLNIFIFWKTFEIYGSSFLSLSFFSGFMLFKMYLWFFFSFLSRPKYKKLSIQKKKRFLCVLFMVAIWILLSYKLQRSGKSGGEGGVGGGVNGGVIINLYVAWLCTSTQYLQYIYPWCFFWTFSWQRFH